MPEPEPTNGNGLLNLDIKTLGASTGLGTALTVLVNAIWDATKWQRIWVACVVVGVTAVIAAIVSARPWRSAVGYCFTVWLTLVTMTMGANVGIGKLTEVPVGELIETHEAHATVELSRPLLLAQLDTVATCRVWVNKGPAEFVCKERGRDKPRSDCTTVTRLDGVEFCIDGRIERFKEKATKEQNKFFGSY